MSRTLQYFKEITGTACDVLDGTIKLEQNLLLNSNKRHYIQILEGTTFPTNIPNIFSYGSINTGLLQVSNGITTTTIQLENGVYNAVQISNAINAVVNSWYTDPNDPAFYVASNSVLRNNYLVIDSTKLGTGTQFSINFGYNGSLLKTVLGFTSPSSFNVDGLYNSNAYPEVDWFSFLDVEVEGLGGALVLINGSETSKIIHFEFYSTSDNYYYYPKNGNTFPIDCEPPSQISQITFRFKGRNDRQIIAFDSRVVINFRIVEY